MVKMADINKRLLTASDGIPAPQHKVKGASEFEFTEGSSGAQHTKIVDSSGQPISIDDELKSIKRTQAEILDRLDNGIDTRVTGSIVDKYIFREELIPANSRFDFTLEFEGDIYAFTINCRVEGNNAELKPKYMFSHGSGYWAAGISYDLPIKDKIRPTGFMSEKIDALHYRARFYIYNDTSNDSVTYLSVRGFGNGNIAVV